MELKIKVSGAVILTEELQTYIEKKVEKLAVFVKNDPTAIIEVEAGTTSAGQRTGDVYRGEVHVTFAGGDAYAEAIHSTLHAALDKAITEAHREVRKKKSKNRDLVRNGAAQVKEFFRNFGK
jgi:ribosomal subunit interface protein